MVQTRIKSPLGTVTIEGDLDGISKISVGDDNFSEEKIPAELEDCVCQLREYFAGNLKTFHLKLNPKGTEFQRKVWNQLAKIPFGKTNSYLELAKNLGDPKSIRAAASANGKNPLWIVVPCHRVIGKDGSLVGYAGGLWRKKWLLEHESPFEQKRLF